MSIPADEQRLIQDGTELKNWRTLAYYGITAESDLHMVLRLPLTPEEKTRQIAAEVAEQEEETRSKLQAEATARAAANARAVAAGALVAAPTQPVTAGSGSIQSDSRRGMTTPLLSTPGTAPVRQWQPAAAALPRQYAPVVRHRPATRSGRCFPSCWEASEGWHACCSWFLPVTWMFLVVFFPLKASLSHSTYMEGFCGSGYISEVHCGPGNEYRKCTGQTALCLHLFATH